VLLAPLEYGQGCDRNHCTMPPYPRQVIA